MQNWAWSWCVNDWSNILELLNELEKHVRNVYTPSSMRSVITSPKFHSSKIFSDVSKGKWSLLKNLGIFLIKTSLQLRLENNDWKGENVTYKNKSGMYSHESCLKSSLLFVISRFKRCVRRLRVLLCANFCFMYRSIE